MVEKFFKGDLKFDDTLSSTLQQELESIRFTLHKVVNSLLKNNESRKRTMDFIATMIRLNEKRAQLHTDESALAGDGFMLNLLSVMQKMSKQIKLEVVDAQYPFDPSSLINIKNETRLKLSSQGAAEFLSAIKFKNQGKEANFSTQFWFLTLHCHHIGKLLNNIL